MLELRQCCEHCGVDLPPHSTDARICSFECTFCAACAEGLLDNICPNCGGNFCPRPIRPAMAWLGDNSLQQHPPVETKLHRPVDLRRHAALVERLGQLPPHKR